MADTAEQFKKKYPESVKMKKVHPKSQIVGEFLEWLTTTRGLGIGRQWTEDDYEDEDKIPFSGPEFVREFVSTEKLLAEFFGIDLNKVEKEKRAMLEEVRNANRIREAKTV